MFLFVIDVSYAAVQSGMLAIAVHSILSSLDRIPNSDDRTRIGFITVDRLYHFYNLAVFFTFLLIGFFGRATNDGYRRYG